MTRIVSRFVSLCAVSALALGVAASAASAHIEISSDNALAGQRADITISVPNERADAATTSIDLRFPEDTPLAEAAAEASGDWVPEVSDAGIVWTGGSLTGEDSADLSFSAVLPEGAESLEFKVLQTYDDGQVSRWIQSTPPGGEEPEFPAPVLAVGPGAGSEHDHGDGTDEHGDTTMTAGGEHDDMAGGTGSSETSDDSGSNTGLIVGAIVLVVALAGGGVVLSRRSRSAK